MGKKKDARKAELERALGLAQTTGYQEGRTAGLEVTRKHLDHVKEAILLCMAKEHAIVNSPRGHGPGAKQKAEKIWYGLHLAQGCVETELVAVMRATKGPTN